MLWARGYITVEKIRAAEKKVVKGKMPKIEFSPKKNRRGFKMTSYVAFSANDWNDKTLQYLKSVNSLETDEVREIMELSRGLVKSRDNRGTEHDQDDEDSQGCLIETTFSSSEIESDHSGDEIPGWGIPEVKGKESRSISFILCLEL